MQMGSLEKNVIDYLSHVPEAAELPVWAELEPGSVIHTLKSFWEERQKDKSPKEIEQFMTAELFRLLKRTIHVSQYRLLFGDKQRNQPAKMEMPYDVVKAYLLILFENWPKSHGQANDNGTHKIDLPFIKEKGLSADDLAIQLRDLIFASGRPVFCRPSTGTGSKGYLYHCSANGYSTICSSQAIPARVENDPIIGLIDWLEDIQVFFSNSVNQDTLFIWAMREPVTSSCDTKTLKALYSINSFRLAVLTLRTLCLSGALPLSWGKLSKRLIFSIYTNRKNDSFRVRQMPDGDAVVENTIPDNDIFFSDIPTGWTGRLNQDLIDNKNYAISIKNAGKAGVDIKYSTYHQHKVCQGRGPLFIAQTSPDEQIDAAYTNLFHACREYAGIEGEGILSAAQSNGWLFMTADEYIKWDIL